MKSEKQQAVSQAVMDKVQREAEKPLDAFYLSSKMKGMFK